MQVISFKERAGCDGGGKGILIGYERTFVVSASGIHYDAICYERQDENESMTVYPIENHPNDSRITLTNNGIVQTLSGRMGTGGGNTPFVLITLSKAGTQSGSTATPQPSGQKAVHAEEDQKDLFSSVMMTPVCVMETSCLNATFTDGAVSPTLCARAGTGGNQLPLVALRIER